MKNVKDYFSLTDREKIEFTSNLLGIKKEDIEKSLNQLYDLIDPASVGYEEVDLCEMLLDSLIYKNTDNFDNFYQAYDFSTYDE